MLRKMGGLLGIVIVSGLALAQEPAASPAPAPAAPAATPAPAPAATPAPATAPAGASVNDAKIICEGKVKVSGQVSLVFTPAAGEAKDVRVTLQKGMKKDEICRDVAKELAVMLGGGYKVSQYDDDKVKVEGKDGARFRITQGANTATGVTLEIK